MINLAKQPSLFVKQLAVAVWGSDTLSKRLVEGKVCPRLKGQKPRPPLTPTKLQAVEACFFCSYNKITSIKSSLHCQ